MRDVAKHGVHLQYRWKYIKMSECGLAHTYSFLFFLNFEKKPMSFTDHGNDHVDDRT